MAKYCTVNNLDELVKTPNSIFENVSHDINVSFLGVKSGYAKRDGKFIPSGGLNTFYKSVIDDHDFSVIVAKEYIFNMRYPWDNNFQHFMIEVFPRLIVFLQLKKLIPELKCIITNIPYVIEIVSRIVNPIDIIIQNEGYIIEHFYTCMLNYNFQQHKYLHECLNILTITLPIIIREKRNVVFIDRLDSKNNVGNKRILLNKEDLLAYIKPDEIVTLEELTINEIRNKLTNINTIITYNGANTIGILFGLNIKKLVIICHPRFGICKGWYEYLFPSVEIFYIKNVFDTSDLYTDTSGNTPYYINMEKTIIEIENFKL